MMKRRQFIKLSAGGGFALMIPGGKLLSNPFFAALSTGLNNPNDENLFENVVPNALDPAFIFQRNGIGNGRRFQISVHPFIHDMGFTDIGTGVRLTPMLGYGNNLNDATYPGKTFQEQSGIPTMVKWQNKLNTVTDHPLPVDTSLHWAYSLQGYTQYSIQQNGIPIVPHLHGGHNESASDGNPEFFFSPGYQVRGPQWVKKEYHYENDQPAGTIWYHDHALGITRLNVYAGMAGFYIIRDQYDTGQAGNPLDLPVYPYEAAFAIQDKMFRDDGSLFYPAFPGDPFYSDFINPDEIMLPEDLFPDGGPTALAEFFGDHIIVNGKLWPKLEVEPRNYRLRFLNGCDSRFLVTEFYAVPIGAIQVPDNLSPLPFTVIGSDQGLAAAPTVVTHLVMETGSRYDIIFNFTGMSDKRIIMKNIAGDTPFGFSYGENLEPDDVFGTLDDPRRTDRIMAFDVTLSPAALGGPADKWNANAVNWSLFGPNVPVSVDEYVKKRKLGLFEGTDEFGRLQPILGTAEPATDHLGNLIYWPNTQPYIDAGLAYVNDDPNVRRAMEGAIAWHSPTTENPALNSVEEWQLFNVTGDSHPIHLHLVHFEILGRKTIKWDSHTIGPDDPSGEEEDRTIPNALHNEPKLDGTYLEVQALVQHNSAQTGSFGSAFRIVNPTPVEDDYMMPKAGYVENAPKDMVTARPGEITFIRARFDKPGRYVWHCHILSHEDHEMMRVIHVGMDPSAMNQQMAMNEQQTGLVQAENYPNPFHDQTHFKVELEKEAQMELAVFDGSGRKVWTLGKQLYYAGVHTITWNGTSRISSSLSAGQYSYQILIDEQLAKSGKMIKV